MRNWIFVCAFALVSVDAYLMLTGSYSVSGYLIDTVCGVGAVDALVRNLHAAYFG